MIESIYPFIRVDGFFDKLKFKVGGESLTISGIEYDRLIANHEDMRAHFAVVCADRGCLPLKNGAYTGKTLDEDLENAANKFVSDERQFKVDLKNKEVQISKIFEWYGEKFLKDPKRPVKEDRPELFLAKWVDDDVKQLLESGGLQAEDRRMELDAEREMTRSDSDNIEVEFVTLSVIMEGHQVGRGVPCFL